MPSVEFGLSSFERGRGDLPELPVINMFVEETPTEERGVVLQSRPGLEDRAADMGFGPVLQLFQRNGVLSGVLFGVSEGILWQGTSQLGAIDGDGPFSMAGYGNFLFVAGGDSLWGWDGATLTDIAFPDSASVLKVIIAASRAVCIRADTGQFYWSDVLETDIEALDFATAENQPDELLDCLFLDDILILFGAETVEFWPNTQDAELPFQPLEGRVIEKGIRGTGCAAAFGSTFAWVTNEHTVCVSDENNVISNPGLQAKIEASSAVSLFSFLIEGLEFLALRLDDETYVFNTRAGRWSQFQSRDAVLGTPINWIPHCFAGGVFGSSIDGRTLAWSTGHQDLESVLERRFRAGFPLNSGGLQISNASLRCNVGQTPFLEGTYVAPLAEMRLSRDGGKTWGAWRQKSLGEQGQYRTQVRWRACGMASRPAFLAEFRVTAPVDFRVSDVLVNEAFGGR